MFSLIFTSFCVLLYPFFYDWFSLVVWKQYFPFHYLYPTSYPLTFLLLFWRTRFKCDTLRHLSTGFIFSSHGMLVQVQDIISVELCRYCSHLATIQCCLRSCVLIWAFFSESFKISSFLGFWHCPTMALDKPS